MSDDPRSTEAKLESLIKRDINSEITALAERALQRHRENSG